MKPTSYPSGLLAALALGVALLAGAGLAAPHPASAATPPPTPPPIGTPQTTATPTPIPIPSGYALPGSYGTPPSGTPSATPSPPRDARKGLDGVWEVQIQRGDKTDYAHFKLAQTGNILSGTYLDTGGKKYPLAGSVDAQGIRLIISMPDGTTILLEGRLDGTTDMVGMFTTSKEHVPFTAAYRPKEKWIENVNPAPGGMGGGAGGGYTPPR